MSIAIADSNTAALRQERNVCHRHGAPPEQSRKRNLYRHFRCEYLSNPFLVSHVDIKSATCRLFKSEKGKCVLPLMPTSGK
jgi:hypothetical protein